VVIHCQMRDWLPVAPAVPTAVAIYRPPDRRTRPGVTVIPSFVV